jgi:O-antigen/teichoic acid export membrane protein
METSHKKKALEASAFVLIGFGLSQVIRLAGNIVLTRLLVPELFGIITIARVFVLGIGLFSDIGLGPAIIRSKRAEDPVLLNTAWTLQIIRGGILSLICFAAAIPVSIIYKEPRLIAVIMAIGFFEIPSAFQSTAITLLNRRLQQKKLAIMEVAIQVASLAFMVAIAYFFRNVWALLIGEFVGVVMRTAWSHMINKELPNKLQYDRQAAKELLSFGKWILISTAMMFLATQADKILLGKLFTLAFFGVYGIAVNLAELPKQIIGRLSEKVIFPLISQFASLPRQELRAKVRGARAKILMLMAAFIALAGSVGDIVIRILYDARYVEAGWMFSLMVFGMWPLILISTVDGCLLSLGKPKYAALGNLAKFIYMVIVVPLFFKLWGPFGAVLAITLNDLPGYVVINAGLRKERISFLLQDAWTTGFLAAVSGLLLGLRYAVGFGFPGISLPAFLR